MQILVDSSIVQIVITKCYLTKEVIVIKYRYRHLKVLKTKVQIVNQRYTLRYTESSGSLVVIFRDKE